MPEILSHFGGGARGRLLFNSKDPPREVSGWVPPPQWEGAGGGGPGMEAPIFFGEMTSDGPILWGGEVPRHARLVGGTPLSWGA